MSTFTSWVTGQVADVARNYLTDKFKNKDKGDSGASSRSGLMTSVELPGRFSVSRELPEAAGRTEMAPVVSAASVRNFWSNLFKRSVSEARITARQRLRSRGRGV